MTAALSFFEVLKRAWKPITPGHNTHRALNHPHTKIKTGKQRNKIKYLKMYINILYFIFTLRIYAATTLIRQKFKPDIN